MKSEELSKREVLRRCIKKAVDNGFKLFSKPHITWFVKEGTYKHEYDFDSIKLGEEFTPIIVLKAGDQIHQIIKMNELIFDLDWAKAFWGEREYYPDSKTEPSHIGALKNAGWQAHLQQLAISEDRIDYLHKFI